MDNTKMYLQPHYRELEKLNRKIDKKILNGEFITRKEMVEHNNLRVFIDHHENS